MTKKNKSDKDWSELSMKEVFYRAYNEAEADIIQDKKKATKKVK